MHIEDYLDDLVFAYHLIAVMKENDLLPLLPKIALRIEELSSKIYPSKYSVSELIEAWSLRKENPILLNSENPSSSEQICLYYHSEEGRKREKKYVLLMLTRFWRKRTRLFAKNHIKNDASKTNCH